MIQHVPASENTVHGLLAKSRNNDHFLAKDPATLWRKSRLAKEMPVLLDHDSQESSTLTVADEPEWDTLEISSTPDVTTGGIGPSTTGPNELISQQPTTPKCRSLPAILDLAYPVDTLNILDNYFKYTHCWFPILEHHDMLRTMHTSAQLRKVHREGSSLVLWALVAYETLQSDTNDTAYPDHLHIQTEILSQVMKSSSSLELGHIQAVLILVLIQIMQDDIAYAWRLTGLASRMLASLPTAARTHRYCHTFHGCVLLDNMTSSVLGRAPCLSLTEQQEEGNINEDSMEEWSVWANTLERSQSRNQNLPQGPLRALSIFNKISSLMRSLARISCTPFNMPHAEASDLSSNLQAEQDLLIAEHPYDHNARCVTPPVLLLHLTINFVVLALVSKSSTLSSTTGKELTGRSLQSTVHLLDLYVEITGRTHKSPLLRCFALKARQCLEIGFPNTHCDQKEFIENRVSSHLPSIETVSGRPNETSGLTHPLSQEVSTETPMIQSLGARADGFPNLSVRTPTLQGLDPHPELPTPAHTTIRVPESPMSFAPRSPRENAFGETGVFDALFEEMVTSMPSNRCVASLSMMHTILTRLRQQPTFAQNLGFYAGDLDKDFLEQLQQPATT